MTRWRVPAAGLLAAVLLVAAYAAVLHGPRRSRIADLVAEAQQLRAQQEPLRRDIAGLEKVKSREDEFTSAQGLLERLIPTGLTQPALIVDLQAAADGAGVKLVSVTFGDPEVAKDAPPSPVNGTVMVVMPLTVVVEGQFANITELLHRVEVDVDRAVLVNGLALTEAEAHFPQLTGTWSGQAYALLRPDDPLVAGSEPAPAKPAAGAKKP
jgi:Tfp pilus assembly protein PilO